MYLKAFEKIFDKKPKPSTEELALENGVTRKIDNDFGSTDFSKREMIDGLEYEFHLSKRKQDREWELGFNTKHGMLITNKGLATYKHIIENIVILINTARRHEKINRIFFGAAGEELRINEMEEFKNFLKSKTEKGAHLFDNFSYIKQIGNWKKSLRIKDGQITIETSGKRPLGIKERVSGENTTWQSANTCAVEKFIDDEFEMSELLNDKETLSALMQHIGAEFSLGRDTDKKDAAKLRINMYERTLKQKFPDCKFERDGNRITLLL